MVMVVVVVVVMLMYSLMTVHPSCRQRAVLHVAERRGGVPTADSQKCQRQNSASSAPGRD